MKALSNKIKLPLASIDESEEENLENLIRNNKKINDDIKIKAHIQILCGQQ